MERTFASSGWKYKCVSSRPGVDNFVTPMPGKGLLCESGSCPIFCELLVSRSISVVYMLTKGEMSERLKEHDWKSCERAKTRSEGSNPSLSAIVAQDARPCATLKLQTPSGSEESSGSD